MREDSQDWVGDFWEWLDLVQKHEEGLVDPEGEKERPIPSAWSHHSVEPGYVYTMLGPAYVRHGNDLLEAVEKAGGDLGAVFVRIPIGPHKEFADWLLKAPGTSSGG